jgi:hypothetical protein
MAGNRRRPRDKATTALSTLLATISRRRPLARAAGVAREEHGTDPLTIEWGAVREPRTQAGVPLTGALALASSWEDMTAADWPDENRMAHLRHLWSQLIGALQSDARSIAA